MKKLCVLMFVMAVAAAATASADDRDSTFVVTSSNTAANELLVYDTAGALVQSVSTQGQGGVGGNAGGLATQRGVVAVVNFGSQTVSLFERRGNGFELRQIIATVSQPVSVAFGKDHLYVLGLTTVESHRIHDGRIDAAPDGTTVLLRADGSAAQVGVAGEQLVITEKSGVIEVVDLRRGAVEGSATDVPLPPDSHDTPFGLVTRGSNAYVTIAHSDLISLVRNGRVIALAATGSNFPDGPGQQAPCWVALAGPYLFSSDSPSHTISRLLATGRNLVVDLPVVASVQGAPIDIAAADGVLAVVESNDGGASHLTQFRIDEDGALVQMATSPIASAANGVVIVSGR